MYLQANYNPQNYQILTFVFGINNEFFSFCCDNYQKTVAFLYIYAIII